MAAPLHRDELLRRRLDALVQGTSIEARRAADPVEFGHRFTRPRDIEVASLIAACFAYGKATVFRVKVGEVLAALGDAPAHAVANLRERDAVELCRTFRYRFHGPADLAALLLGIQETLERDGSLEGLFARGLPDVRCAISNFARTLKARGIRREVTRRLGRPQALEHLLPEREAGAAKRLNLYLRWMVRPADGVDFGLWTCVTPAQLVVPLDTHLARVSRMLGLTRRASDDWKTAVEITAALARLDADDPVKYDFALCHHGMSGACPARWRRANCEVCVLAPGCERGRAVGGVRFRREQPAPKPLQASAR